MNRSNIFLATIILIGLALLIIFGISALPPLVPETADDAGQTQLGTPLDEPTVLFGNPMRGPQDALVTAVEFGDFQCLPCKDMDASLLQLLQDFPDDLRVVWKDFPDTSQHKEALNAAIAARCAGIQGMFWEYHDLLLANQASINASAYPIFASQLGLDETSFAGCLQDETTRPIVERDFEEGLRLRLDATPYVFVNKRRVSGALRYELLKEIVRSEIEKAKATRDAAGAPAQP